MTLVLTLSNDHFIDSCPDTVNPSKHLRFILIDCVINTGHSSKKEIDDLLLEKKILDKNIMHKRLDNYHD